MKCNECDRPLEEGTKFCTNCGAETSTEELVKTDELLGEALSEDKEVQEIVEDTEVKIPELAMPSLDPEILKLSDELEPLVESTSKKEPSIEELLEETTVDLNEKADSFTDKIKPLDISDENTVAAIDENTSINTGFLDNNAVTETERASVAGNIPYDAQPLAESFINTQGNINEQPIMQENTMPVFYTPDAPQNATPPSMDAYSGNQQPYNTNHGYHSPQPTGPQPGYNQAPMAPQQMAQQPINQAQVVAVNKVNLQGIPAGFALDPSSGLYYQSVNKQGNLGNPVQQVTYYNPVTSEMTVVDYPVNVGHSSLGSAPPQKKRVWPLVLAGAMVLVIIIGIVLAINLINKRTLKPEDNTLPRESGLDRWNGEVKDYEDDSYDNFTPPLIDDITPPEVPSGVPSDDVNADGNYVLSPLYVVRAQNPDYFQINSYDQSIKFNQGSVFRGYFYVDHPNDATGFYLSDKIYRTTEDGTEAYCMLDLEENGSIYSFDVAEDKLFVGILPKAYYESSSYDSSLDYYMIDLKSEEVTYIFTAGLGDIELYDGFMYINIANEARIICVGYTSTGRIDGNFMYYTYPSEDFYADYASTSLVGDEVLTATYDSAEDTEHYYAFNLNTEESEEILIGNAREYITNLFTYEDKVFYTAWIYEDDDVVEKITVAYRDETGAENIITSVDYPSEDYLNNNIFGRDETHLYYYDGTEVQKVSLDDVSTKLTSLAFKDVYGICNGVILTKTDLIDARNSDIVVHEINMSSKNPYDNTYHYSALENSINTRRDLDDPVASDPDSSAGSDSSVSRYSVGEHSDLFEYDGAIIFPKDSDVLQTSIGYIVDEMTKESGSYNIYKNNDHLAAWLQSPEIREHVMLSATTGEIDIDLLLIMSYGAFISDYANAKNNIAEGKIEGLYEKDDKFYLDLTWQPKSPVLKGTVGESEHFESGNYSLYEQSLEVTYVNGDKKSYITHYYEYAMSSACEIILVSVTDVP